MAALDLSDWVNDQSEVRIELDVIDCNLEDSNVEWALCRVKDISRALFLSFGGVDDLSDAHAQLQTAYAVCAHLGGVGVHSGVFVRLNEEFARILRALGKACRR
eukprot:96441_1